MRRDDLYLSELLEATLTVRAYLDRGGPDWAHDPVMRDAVLHRLILMGEIAGAVSDELRGRHPEVQWSRMRAFRNTAIHEYFAIDWARVRRIAVDEVPALETQIRAVLQQEYPEIARHYDQED
jgi:uncharacterized protein with HEPN domain